MLFVLVSLVSSSNALLAAPSKWRTVAIGSAEPSLSPLTSGDAIRQGEVLILIEDIVQACECEELITAARQGTAAECAKRAVKGLPAQSLTRLPVAAAKQRAEATKTPCADPLDDTASALCEEILLRVMALIDNEIPSIATALFSLKADDNNVPRLTDLSAAGALEFSSREPAINLYGPGGEFLPHMDHQSLTVLIPLTSPAPIEKSTCPPLAPPPPLQQQIDGESALDSGAPFSGGGTGFWSQDARGPRVEGPTLVMRPPAGSAMLFGGKVTHAGLPVDEGTRVVFVASFSRVTQGGRAQRARDAEQARDIYGDYV